MILIPIYKLQVKTGKLGKQPIPFDHARHICTYHEADDATVEAAIEGALAAKAEWESMPWNDRAAIFLKAADLASGKYRYRLMAATIIGQGKNIWQAEIDAAAEVSCPSARDMTRIYMLITNIVNCSAHGLLPFWC
jgi:1-pyrroline-5-carboxylate dehydrogenase